MVRGGYYWRKPGENLEKPGDTREDMELNKNKDTYILLSWGEDTECLLNTVWSENIIDNHNQS